MVLDVVVTDKQGNVVTGLTKDDFNVTDAGEPQTVTDFDVSARHLANPDVTINSTADLDTLAPEAPVNIILLDEFNTLLRGHGLCALLAQKVPRKQPDKLSTPTMLIAVGLQIHRAARLHSEQGGDPRFAGPPLRRIPLAGAPASWVAERLPDRFRHSAPRRRGDDRSSRPQEHDLDWARVSQPQPGQASVDSERRVENAVQECVNMLRDARVTLYTIDPAGLMVEPDRKYGNEAAHA